MKLDTKPPSLTTSTIFFHDRCCLVTFIPTTLLAQLHAEYT